jgi:hypothetical protein
MIAALRIARTPKTPRGPGAALALDDHVEAAETDADADYLGEVDAFAQEQRGKDQDKHRHATEQQRGQAGRHMHLAIVEQVVGNAEVGQGHEHKEPAARGETGSVRGAPWRNTGTAGRRSGSAGRRMSGAHALHRDLDPQQVVPQLRHTIKNITLVTRPANHCFWVLFWRCFRARRTLASFIASLSRN